MLKISLNEYTSNEKYIDPEQKYYDYGTGTVTGTDIFDDRTHVPFYDQLFTKPEYMAKEENLKGTVVMMTPREYFKNCAYKIFNTSVEALKSGRARDNHTNNEIKDIITTYKRQVFLPYINYAEKSQEGLHRMLVAAELFGWDQEFPVLVVEWADEERAIRIAKEKQDSEVRRKIGNAVNKACRYIFNDYEDFESQLKYSLDAEFQYMDEPVKTLEIRHDKDSNTSYVTVNGVTYSFATHAISIEEKSPDDEDLDDFEFTDEELDDMANLSLDDFLRKYG